MLGIVERIGDPQRDLTESVMDAMIIAAAQRAEDYEMAVYGTVAARADPHGRCEMAGLLRDARPALNEAWAAASG